MDKKVIKKEAEKVKKEAPQPVKEYYNVKVEVTAPVTLTYKVLAESPEQAIEFASKLNGRGLVCAPAISFGRLRVLKAVCYNAGSLLIRLTRCFV